jgi:hypothetical protein
MPVTDLNPSERALWLGFPQGAEIDLRTGDPSSDDPRGGLGWGEDRTVRAEVIASLALGEQSGGAGQLAMIRLRGARISGELRLSFASVRDALILEECWFETSPDGVFPLFWTPDSGCQLAEFPIS